MAAVRLCERGIKMVRAMRKIMAAALALVIMLVPMVASAEELTTTETKKETTTVDENGNTVVTVTVKKDTTGTDDDGYTVVRTETRTDTTVTDPDGNVIGTQWEEDGQETKSKSEEVLPGEDVPVVVVPLTPGKTTEGNKDDSSSVTENDVVITTTISREVAVETSEAEWNTSESATELESIQCAKDPNKQHMYVNNWTDPAKATVTGSAPAEGYEYQFVGEGDHSKLWASKIKVIYKKDENNQPVVDENGNYVIEKLTKADGTVMLDPETLEPSTDFNEMWKYYDKASGTYKFAKTGTRPTMFLLKTEDGDHAYAYCIDLVTGADKKDWYGVANLEDSDYYPSEETENHVRAVVVNGYWGSAEGTGSLANVKAALNKALSDGLLDEEISITYYPGKDGGEVNSGKERVTVTFKTADIINDITEGEAMNATQAAIWSYSNGCPEILPETDGMVLANVIYGEVGVGNNYTPEGAARMDIFYRYLMGLDPMKAESVVINEKTSVKDVTLSVGGLAADRMENEDADKTNDVYHAGLNFKLAFTPGDKDDLLVQIKYTDLDGNDVTVIKRLAGENSEGRMYDSIYPDENGNYTIENLVLSENKDFGFDLRLEGTQHLKHGVYLYTPYGGRGESQSMVGLGEGTHSVDVNLGMTITFDVDENKTVVAKREWHDDNDPTYAPRKNKVTLHRGDVVTIEEEPVPLADAPKTGDMASVIADVVVLAACLLVALHIATRKRVNKGEQFCE